MRRCVVGLLIAVLLVLCPTPWGATARADDGVPITRFHADVTLLPDGTADVTIDFTMDFSQLRGRGPVYVLPYRQSAGNGKDYLFTYGPVQWSSPSGAASAVHTERTAKTLTMRVGDADTFYTTPQDYRLTYTAKGLIAPNHEVSGLDEFNWDAIGTGWDLAFSDVSASVSGPVQVAQSYCHWGRQGTQSCTTDRAGSTATFSVDRLNPHELFQVTASFPAGTFVGAEQRLVEAVPSERPFTLNAATGLVSGGLLLAAAGVLLALWRRAAYDEVFLDVTPGLIPKGAPATGRRRRLGPVAAQFHPPPGAPGEIRVLMKGRVDRVAASATLVDLAARGYLTIDSSGHDVTLTRTDQPAAGLLGYEESLLARIFRSKEVTAKTLKKNTRLGSKVVKGINGAVKNRQWLVRHSFGSLQAMRVVGFFVTFIGIGMTALLGLLRGWGLVGIPIALFGIGLFLVSLKTFRRTAKGSAVLAQAEGFKLYLATAERDTLRFEEGIDVFSRYLPYAMVFGVADRWSALFASLARDGSYTADLTWLRGTQIGDVASLSATLGSVSSAMTSVTQMAVSTGVGGSTGGSSGGSGSSGGGGFGGSGGGSW